MSARVALFGKPKCGKCSSAADKLARDLVPGVLAWVKIETEQVAGWGDIVAMEAMRCALGLSGSEARLWAIDALAAWAILDGDLPIAVIEGRGMAWPAAVAILKAIKRDQTGQSVQSTRHPQEVDSDEGANL
jgi:hypothetical protein